MSKRAVLYARVSSDDRDRPGRNLEGQIEMCREYALSKGYVVIAELTEDDRGASGASLELEQLSQVREMAHRGAFDILVVREIDRFARSLAKQLIVEEELRRGGVEIEYVLGEYPDTPEGNLMKNVKASIAEYERLKIVERTSRAKMRSIRDGNVTVYGNPPYGYREAERDGKRTLEVYEPEARVVRMFFSWYVNGDKGHGPISIAEITRRLTKMAIPTRADTSLSPRMKKQGRGVWSRATVHGMLKNETYAGVWYYGKKGSNGNGHISKRPRSQWISVEVPAITSRDVWEAAQQRLEYNRLNSKRNRKNEYLLSGRVTCGICRHKMSGSAPRSGRKVYYYYVCPCAAQKGAYAGTCNLPRLNATEIDTAVWEWVKNWLVDPEQLRVGLEGYREIKQQKNAPLCERLAVINDLLAGNQAKQERLVDLYLAGDFDRAMLAGHKKHLDDTARALGKERTTLTAALEAGALTPEQIESLLEFASKVRSKLKAADKSFGARRRIIELLDVQVTLTVEPDDQGEMRTVVYAACALGEDTFRLCRSPQLTT